MRKAYYITILALIMIACLQGYNINLQYNNYVLSQLDLIDKILERSIDEELNLRSRRNYKPDKTGEQHFYMKMLPQGAMPPPNTPKENIHNLAAFDIKALKKKGIVNTSSDILMLVQEDNAEKKGNPINLYRLDSLFTKNLGKDYPHAILLLDKKKQVVRTEGKLTDIPSSWEVTKDHCISLVNPRFIRIAIGIPLSQFFIHSIGTLILSLLFVLIGVICIAYQLREIRWRTDLLENRETSVNGIIHDLKAPLNNIIMAISIIKMKITDTDIKELLVTTNNRAKDLVSDIEQILMAASGETKRIILNPEPVKLGELAEKAKTDVEDFYTEKSPQISIVDEMDKRVKIMADKMYITNVFRNLMENAVKYSDPSVNIAVHIQSKEDKAIVSVSDNGWGISKKDQKQIFKQFYRVPHKQNPKGFGIGLALVKYVVEAHKGNVIVESELGKGSTFTFTLPYKS